MREAIRRMSLLRSQFPRLGSSTSSFFQARSLQRLNSTLSTATLSTTPVAPPPPVTTSSPSTVTASSDGASIASQALSQSFPETETTTASQLDTQSQIETQVRTQKRPSKQTRIYGRVVAAGRMPKTITVEVKSQKWNNYVHKNFSHKERHLVHDEHSQAVEGDVISLVRRHFDSPSATTRLKTEAVESTIATSSKSNKKKGTPRSQPGTYVNTNKKFEVGEIVTPYGTPVEERGQSHSAVDENATVAV